MSFLELLAYTSCLLSSAAEDASSTNHGFCSSESLSSNLENENGGVFKEKSINQGSQCSLSHKSDIKPRQEPTKCSDFMDAIDHEKPDMAKVKQRKRKEKKIIFL